MSSACPVTTVDGLDPYEDVDALASELEHLPPPSRSSETHALSSSSSSSSYVLVASPTVSLSRPGMECEAVAKEPGQEPMSLSTELTTSISSTTAIPDALLRRGERKDGGKTVVAKATTTTTTIGKGIVAGLLSGDLEPLRHHMVAVHRCKSPVHEFVKRRAFSVASERRAESDLQGMIMSAIVADPDYVFLDCELKSELELRALPGTKGGRIDLALHSRAQHTTVVMELKTIDMHLVFEELLPLSSASRKHHAFVSTMQRLVPHVLGMSAAELGRQRITHEFVRSSSPFPTTPPTPPVPAHRSTPLSVPARPGMHGADLARRVADVLSSSSPSSSPSSSRMPSKTATTKSVIRYTVQRMVYAETIAHRARAVDLVQPSRYVRGLVAERHPWVLPLSSSWPAAATEGATTSPTATTATTVAIACLDKGVWSSVQRRAVTVRTYTMVFLAGNFHAYTKVVQFL